MKTNYFFRVIIITPTDHLVIHNSDAIIPIGEIVLKHPFISLGRITTLERII